MIKTFRCKETARIYRREYSRRLPRNIQQAAMLKLWMVDASVELNDLRFPPGNRLEPLKSNRKGQYSIRINDQWRICFEWREGQAYQVEIVDYH
jgi:toxin HigB-1